MRNENDVFLCYIRKMDRDNPNIKRERWMCFMQFYVNSKKTLAEGRRVSVNRHVRTLLVLTLVVAAAISSSLLQLRSLPVV